MIDTPSIRDVVTEATNEAEAPKAESQEVQTPASVEPQETTQPEETFAEKGDLSGKTPEQLEEIYKNWQRSYTEKRQKETQQLKELQAKLSQLEKQPAVPQSQPIEQRAAQAQEQVQLGNMSVTQYTEYIKQLVAEQAQEIARKEYESLKSQEHEETLASKAEQDFVATDSRLNEHGPEYDENFANEVRRELAELLDKHLEETGSYKGFNTAELTKQVIEKKDKVLDEIIKKRTLQSTQAAKMREVKAQKSAVRGTTLNGKSLHGDSIRDILSEAVDAA